MVPPEKVPVLLFNQYPLTVTAPVNVIVKFAFTVSWLPDAIVIDVQAAFAVTVTVLLPSITTRSPATGVAAAAVPPEVNDQVELVFQLPFAME